MEMEGYNLDGDRRSLRQSSDNRDWSRGGKITRHTSAVKSIWPYAIPCSNQLMGNLYRRKGGKRLRRAIDCSFGLEPIIEIMTLSITMGCIQCVRSHRDFLLTLR